MQRRSSNSSITAVAMLMSTRFPKVRLNGKAVAKEIGDEITDKVMRMRDAIGVTPICDIRIKENSVVVIGNGTDTDIVAPPVAYLLQRHGAKVTVVHRGTENLAEIVSQADILISATERAYLVKGRWIKPGTIVIDTGSNRIRKNPGYRFVGDVCYEENYEWASVITPAPGGVESMTTAMLLSNTLRVVKRALKFE
ncbi:hypothetical protein C5167_045116 [Papaver somniferum]|uniref:methenyltetrahydrofolate cyclohydrolase n=2 Tax=Papaver somniferum TaxID=3469 RepID=A0A4Y7LDH2_PAPSO|nr:hypothetical protein C5167_045116 [Papaver somniferum]